MAGIALFRFNIIMSKDFSFLINALQELNSTNLNYNHEPELQTMEEIEADYIEFAKKSKDLKYDWGNWLPSFRKRMRPLLPGELGIILAETGVGKTTILHNIAMSTKLETILFEIELPNTLTFERFLQLQTQTKGEVIERTYESGQKIEWNKSAMSHINVCSLSRLNIESIERIINNAHTKTGKKPALILIDYIGLVGGKGTTRYERASYVSEELKKVARSTNTAIICASQVSRKKEDQGNEIKLTDGKDSGSIENSSGVVLGAWREGDGGNTMKIRILKQTKGIGQGFTVECIFNGETSLISERSPYGI